jgi:DNA-binding response OmpR family regulator
MDGTRILVIDDSTTLRKLVEIAMRGTGCTIDFAGNGSDGVSRARSHRPDVVLLDYLLPDLPSSEVCQRLHDDTATSSVPVVIMSANERTVLDDFRTFGSVVGFIGKPFTAAEIRSRLEGVVRRRARSNGAASTEIPVPVSDRIPILPAPSTTAPVAAEDPDALQLRGTLAATPLLEVLRLLSASHATGTLVIDRDRRGDAARAGNGRSATSRIWLRRGEILMCFDASSEASMLGELTPELRDRLARNLVVGKPALINLAEIGVTRATNLPLELHAASARIVGEMLDARSGRFSWEPAVTLPDFVEAFGRHVSLTAVALDHARRAAFASRSPRVLEQVYDRTPRFSEKLAGARLSADEQRVLAYVDGQTQGRDVVARARQPADRGAAVLTRLCAADLIHHDPASRAAVRTLAVVGGGEDLVAPLRGRLGGGIQPTEIVELDPSRPLAAAILEAHPSIVLIDVAKLTPQVLEHDLPVLARDGTIGVVCVLESPDPELATRMLRAGLHAVIARPVHLTEIERLLSG